MTSSVDATRKRMALGEPVDGDLAWCRRRLEVLAEWPDALNREQLAEQKQLMAWTREYAE